MNSAPTSPAVISKTAERMTLRTPNRSIRAAENGPISPNRASRKASAVEISPVSQPNSLLSDRISAPGSPMAPAVVNSVTNVTATTTHP